MKGIALRVWLALTLLVPALLNNRPLVLSSKAQPIQAEVPLDAGAAFATVQRLAGHADVSTTVRYGCC